MSRFCTECGGPLKPEEQFCSSCGTPFVVEKQKEVIPNVAVATREKKPMTKGKKMIYTALLILFVIAMAGHFTIKSLTSTDKAIQKIYNAIITNDENSLFEAITLAKDSKYNKKSYITYLKEQDMDSFFATLSSNAKETEADGIVRIVTHEDGTDLFRIQKGKMLYFYPIIEVVAASSDLLVETDLKNVNFIFNNQKVEFEGKNINLGSFLPGDYTYEVSTEKSIYPNGHKSTLFINTSESENILSFMAKELQITLDGDEPDSTVFINNVSTKKSIKELKAVGPIFDNTDIELHVEKKMLTGENAVSHKEFGTALSDIHFTYPSDISFVEKTPEELAEEKFDRVDLEDFVLDFRDAYGQSLNEKSFSLIKPYLLPNSSAYNELKKFTDDLGNDYFDYEFTHNEVTNVDFNVDQASVSTYEEFYFTNHKSDTTFYQRDKKYDIVVDDDGAYKIQKIHIYDTKKNR